uniref:Glycoside hydrolase family 65 central catalytic domain-containing protein n=1 Tax=Eutreptiella gymnastica TaxID=73025 RepID=A0A7S4LEI1_9EUGL
MLNVTNSLPILLTIEGESFSMFQGTVLAYTRVLSFQSGQMSRSVMWRSAKGHEVQVNVVRMCSQKNKHLAVIRYSVNPLNFDGKIEISSGLDGNVSNMSAADDPRVGANISGQALQTIYSKQDQTFAALEQRTQASGFFLVCAMENSLEGANATVEEVEYTIHDQKKFVKFSFEGKKGETVVLTKYIAYVSSRDYEKDEIHRRARQVVTTAKEEGFAKAEEDQRSFYDAFWEHADVEIRGDAYLQQGMRFNLFHLVQSVGRDGLTNVGAKGLTGEGYNGHYFWDGEVYVMPFFLYTNPDMAKPLLLHRYHTLDAARRRARELNINKGCLFPWRTICGEECSSFFPAGTAQVHINADIAYCFKSYISATNDVDFVLNYGAEVLFETARAWIELGTWQAGSFQIHGVTGPDEYTAIVDNNFYTNIMAQMNLQYACELYKILFSEHPETLQKLKAKIGMLDGEELQWEKAWEKMYLPHDKTSNIHPQDDSFLKKKPWAFEDTPRTKYPLLMHFHPLVIYKHRVCKQADLILAHFLLGDKFTLKEKKADFDFYEPLTTHDSSLSTSIFSIVASEIGYHTKAYEYFMCTARMDIDDVNKNVAHGIHTACMGGAWLCLVAGFAGMRVYNKTLHFDPYLPMEWDSYLFHLSFKNARLKVEVLEKSVIYTLVEGQSLRFIHSGHTRVSLKSGKSVTLKLKDKFTDIATLEFDGVIFDMDLFTSNIDIHHQEAWMAVLNDFLELRGKRDAKDYAPITEEEYGLLKHTVSGADRHAGLKQFLRSRGLDVPMGCNTDPPTEESLSGLGNAKRAKFREIVSKVAVTPNPDDLNLLKDLREEGIQVACVSYSKNCRWLMEKAGLAHLFDSIIGGQKFSSLGLKGKPHADLYYRAAEEMGTQPRRCVAVVSDINGYGSEAFKHFKLVLGSSMPEVGEEADQAEPSRVINGFKGVTTDTIEEWVKEEHSRCGFRPRMMSRTGLHRESSSPRKSTPETSVA